MPRAWIVRWGSVGVATVLWSCAPSAGGGTLSFERASGRLTINGRQPDVIRLAAIGDLHGGSEVIAAALRHEHARVPLDGVLVLGDNFDRCGVASPLAPEWRGLDPLLGLGIPLFPVLGNHDYGNPKDRFGVRVCGEPSPSAQLQRSWHDTNWMFPARNYVLDTPLAGIVMVDTTPLALRLRAPLLGSSTAEEVTRFVRKELRGARAPWRIVAGHHNAHHSGVERRGSAGVRRNMAEFARLLSDERADLYLSAHQHHLEILSDGRPPLYVISGVGRRPRRAETLRRRDARSRFATTLPSNSAGYAIIEIRERTIEVSLHDARGQTLARTVEGSGGSVPAEE